MNKPADCKSTHIYSDSSWYAETLHDFKKNLENRALIIPQYIIIIGLFIILIVFFQTKFFVTMVTDWKSLKNVESESFNLSLMNFIKMGIEWISDQISRCAK